MLTVVTVVAPRLCLAQIPDPAYELSTARVAVMTINRQSGAELLDAHSAEERRIRALPQDEQRETRAQQRRESRRLTVEAEERLLLRAVNAGANGRFVVVFLRGAYDPLSVLVPYAEPFYYEARPNIAIAPPDAADPMACLRLDGRCAPTSRISPSSGSTPSTPPATS
jgi:hypothetical protein